MLISFNYINKVCSLVEDKSIELEDLINAEKWQEADKLSNDLYYTWLNQSRIMTIFIHHEEIDELNNEFLKLTQYVKTKSKDEALASNHTIKFFSKNILNLQKVNISNIF